MNTNTKLEIGYIAGVFDADGSISFKKYPKKWVSDPERVSTINEFCFQYARTDKNWEKKWKDFFLSIN